MQRAISPDTRSIRLVESCVAAGWLAVRDGCGTDDATVDLRGSFLYVANGGSNDVSVFSINGANGALTEMSGSPFAAGTVPECVAIPAKFGRHYSPDPRLVLSATVVAFDFSRVSDVTSVSSDSCPM
jgi:DNA-binding beta-propeller fold protein YncE